MQCINIMRFQDVIHGRRSPLQELCSVFRIKQMDTVKQNKDRKLDKKIERTCALFRNKQMLSVW